MTERERIIGAMAVAMRQAGNSSFEGLADAALRVIERPVSGEQPYYVICTCGQNGYPPGSTHSNHDHLEGCPHYDG